MTDAPDQDGPPTGDDANGPLLEALLGAPIARRRRVARGFTPVERSVVELAGGRSVFVKAAVNDLTAAWLRKEHRMYAELQARFMADLVGWIDRGERPILVLEDLSGASWPPPWGPERIETVLGTLADVAATPPPTWLPPASAEAHDGWELVAADPAPLLATGIVSSEWLALSLPRLIEAADPSVAAGDALCHFDVRSDNVCFRDDGSAVLIDWNLAEVGNPRLDIAFWLPSLAIEGGPAPEAILPGAAAESAAVSGYFAARCGRPLIPEAPAVRSFQLLQLREALPWACRSLGLTTP